MSSMPDLPAGAVLLTPERAWEAVLFDNDQASVSDRVTLIDAVLCGDVAVACEPDGRLLFCALSPPE